MRRFPISEDLTWLVGDELSQITLDPYQVSFRFVNGSFLNAEFGVEYIDEGCRTHHHDPQRRLGPAPVSFHVLLEDHVERIQSADFRLTLTFRSGRRLVILSDEGRYEAGQMGHPSVGLIVF